jgi:hypothetical protein
MLDFTFSHFFCRTKPNVLLDVSEVGSLQRVNVSRSRKIVKRITYRTWDMNSWEDGSRMLNLGIVMGIKCIRFVLG